MFFHPHVHLEISALKADFVQAQRAKSYNLWNVLDFDKVAFQVALVKSGNYRTQVIHVTWFYTMYSTHSLSLSNTIICRVLAFSRWL